MLSTVNPIFDPEIGLSFIYGSQCMTPHKPADVLQGQACRDNLVEAQEIKRSAISDFQIPVIVHFTQC